MPIWPRPRPSGPISKRISEPEPTRLTEPNRMSTLGTLAHRLHDEEIALLRKLRAGRKDRLKPADCNEPSFGDRVSDAVAAMMGSWPFIIIQSFLLIAWMTLNLTAWV